MTTGLAGFSDRETEFVVGSVRAFRTWSLRAVGAPELHGSWCGTWRPGENTASCFPMRRAEKACRHLGCACQEHHREPVPYDMCGCGFWAYTDLSGYPDFDHNAWFNPQLVVGVVECYGRTLTGPRGVRCEKARVVALCQPHPAYSGDPLRHAYRVPVYVGIREMLDRHPLTTPAELGFGPSPLRWATW